MHLHHPHHEVKPRHHHQKRSKRFWLWSIGAVIVSLVALFGLSQVTESRIAEKRIEREQRYQVSDVEVLTEKVDLVLARITRVISEKPEFVAGTTVTQNLRTIEVEFR